MKTVKIAAQVLLTIFVASGVAFGAIKMQPTPIQDQMNLAIAGANYAAQDDFDEFDDPSEKKPDSNTKRTKRVSIAKAALLSALLPGLGEYHIGNRTKARYFFGAEALTWASFVAFRMYGSWKKDDLIRFAAQYANADLEGKSDDFLDWVGFYSDIYEFNTRGRVGDPDRPYLQDTPENHWVWISPEYQAAYRDLKNSSREAYRKADFMIGVAIVNRVISVIDAIRDAKRANRQLDDNTFGDLDKLHYKFRIDPLSLNRQISLTIYTPF
ncbi:MAG: hypothetical protein JSV52_09860 [Candidatus Zixiibacteriota bacterium]|nr:MAG: hypothetical protein JSV52_09860 [candidate division Zixibacteria bacterium]